jgi:hypothetical protein
MSQSDFPDNQYLQNVESFGEYLQSLKKKSNEQKIKFAEKIFFESYYEYIQERMNSHDALQKAIRVAFCFLTESKM